MPQPCSRLQCRRPSSSTLQQRARHLDRRGCVARNTVGARCSCATSARTRVATCGPCSMRRGHRITGVEPGPTLAAQARANLASYTDVTVVCASFDTWTPPAWGRVRSGVRGDGPAFGSTPQLDISVPTATCARAVRWRSGPPRTSSQMTVIRSSSSCNRCTTTSASLSRATGFPQARDARRPGGRGHCFRPVRPGGRAALRLGDDLRRGRLHRAARHLLRAPDHATVAAPAPVRRDRRRLTQRPTGTLRRHWGAILHGATRTS